MTTRKEEAPRQSEPLQVQSFLKGIWLHSHLTPETAAHRQKALRVYISFMSNATNTPSLDYNNFFAFLAGSSMRAVDAYSDCDFALCYDGENEDELQQVIDKYKHEREQAAGDYSLDFLYHAPVNYFLQNIAKEETLLKETDDSTVIPLFTPNEFVRGNIALANNHRLQLVQAIASNDSKKLWDAPHSRIRTWFGSIFLHKYLQYGRKGQREVENIWQDIRMEVEKMPFPSFKTYESAITQSGGALTIS